MRNSALVFGANGVGILLSFIQGVLVARELGAQLYGVFAVITAFTMVMGQAFDSRSWEVSVKYVTEFLGQNDERRALAVIKLGFIVDIVTGLTSFALAWVLAEWAAITFLGHINYAEAIKIYAFSLLFGWTGGTSALTRVLDRFDLSTKVEVAVSAFRLVGVLLVLYVVRGDLSQLLWLFVLVSALTLGASLLVLRILLRSTFKTSLLRAPLGSLWDTRRQIGMFMLSTDITAILKIVQGNGALLALGYWSTPTEAGYYKLAQGLSSCVTVLSGPVFQSVYPELTRLYAKKKISELQSLVKKLILLPLGYGIPLVAVSCAAGSSIVMLLAGDQYEPAASAFAVLVGANTVAAITIWIGPFLLATGDAHLRASATLVGVLVMLATLALLVPGLGAFGGAAAFLAFHLGCGAFGGLAVFLKLKSLAHVKLSSLYAKNGANANER